MLFNSFQFSIFFVVVLSLVLALPRRFEPRILLASSLIFYACWMPALVTLLLFLLGANYGLLRLMVKSSRPRRHLVASVMVTLGALALFKYGAFVAGMLSPHFPAMRSKESALAALTLPLGISFYSFEIISVAVDVYKGRLPCPSLSRYALFVSFFPHLIAGPILRGGELLPQFDAGGVRNAARTRRGLWLFSVGLLKKTLLSDYLLLPFVSEVFGAPGAFPGPVHLIAMYAFAFQIYFDFSGYTDMARGLACLLGYELPMNFLEPYLSRDPSEFWRRWHATLSRWLRDYLYVPLGGNRRGTGRVALNLLVTMVLGGLWHGAGSNFVLWGALHGLALVIHRFFGKRGDPERPLAWSDVPGIVVLFHVVCLFWIPFRAATWADTRAFLSGLSSGGYGHAWPVVQIGIVALCAALHGFERWVRQRLPSIHERLGAAWWGAPLEGALLGAACSSSRFSGPAFSRSVPRSRKRRRSSSFSRCSRARSS
jgi:D-alanyl-lipoteichoic acid acyltransferase DltB (MBOAT superfamily)